MKYKLLTLITAILLLGAALTHAQQPAALYLPIVAGGTVPTAEPTPEPTATATPVPTATGERDLDPMLAELGTWLEEAQVEEGESYWRITSVEWLDKAEAQGRHHIDIDQRDNDGERVLGATARVWWPDGEAVLVQEDKPAPEYGANFGMYVAVAHCPYSVEALGLPSDRLHCVGLGTPDMPHHTIHTVYRVVFVEAVREE